MREEILEELLQRKAVNEPHLVNSGDIKKETAPPRLTSEHNATLEDFMEMISKLVTRSMKKEKVQFNPDEGARLALDTAEKLEHPYIFYELIERVPKTELKPRPREEVVEITTDEGSKRQGRIWGQKFKCIIQFNVLACDYKTAGKVMNNLESLIFNYTGYFRKKGIGEILFQRHFTDRNLDPYRQSISCRSIQYYVELEKLFVEFMSDIEKVDIN